MSGSTRARSSRRCVGTERLRWWSRASCRCSRNRRRTRRCGTQSTSTSTPTAGAIGRGGRVRHLRQLLVHLLRLGRMGSGPAHRVGCDRRRPFQPPQRDPAHRRRLVPRRRRRDAPSASDLRELLETTPLDATPAVLTFQPPAWYCTSSPTSVAARNTIRDASLAAQDAMSVNRGTSACRLHGGLWACTRAGRTARRRPRV
jgi:hypothetical protein